MIKKFFLDDTPLSIGLGIFTVSFLLAGGVTAWVILLYNGVSALGNHPSTWDGSWGFLLPVLIFSALFTASGTFFAIFEYRLHQKKHV